LANPRIISGKARGIRLQSVPGDITRPITDRVKEALFNILGADIQDVSFLDLFGGTGSVGIEALSRGAGFARFIDLNQPAISTIKTNLERTHLKEKAEVVHMDAFFYLKRPADRSFEYIYIAPPQYKGLWQQSLIDLDCNPGWLSPDAWVIVQIHPIEYEKMRFKNFEEFEQRRYGSTILVFYEKTALTE
jgi:16S rRNA (guanine(966)-N(2))-methyltransferase RsmD